MPKYNELSEEEKTTRKNVAAGLFARIAMEAMMESMKAAQCPCPICDTKLSVYLFTGVINAAAAEHLMGHPEHLKKINDFFEEFIKDNPDIKPKV